MNTEGSHDEEPHYLEERRAEEDHSVVLEHPSENSAASRCQAKKSSAINAIESKALQPKSAVKLQLDTTLLFYSGELQHFAHKRQYAQKAKRGSAIRSCQRLNDFFHTRQQSSKR